MNKLTWLLSTMAALTLAACSDGVPKVDDPNHPLDANGNSISGTEFLKQYCVAAVANKDCLRVNRAVSLKSDKGVMPKGY